MIISAPPAPDEGRLLAAVTAAAKEGDGAGQLDKRGGIFLRQQVTQLPEQFAKCVRRLVALALVERIADQLPQMLAVGVLPPAGAPEPSARPASLRRSRARMRSISRRWLNGLVM